MLRARHFKLAGSVLAVLAILCVNSDPGAAKQGITARRLEAIGHFEEIAARAFFKLWLGVPVSLDWRGPCEARQVAKALRDKSRFPASLYAPSGTGVNRRARYCRPVNAIIRDDKNTRFDLFFPKLDGCQRIVGEIERIIKFKAVDDLVVRPETYERYGIGEKTRDNLRYYRQVDVYRTYQEREAAFHLSKIFMTNWQETEVQCRLSFEIRNWGP
jgi:hypothetical protein